MAAPGRGQPGFGVPLGGRPADARPGRFVAFEVGEVRRGKLRLDEVVLPLGLAAGFRAHGVLVNTQTFTKTAHIWGVGNNDKGTNSNRVVLFER